MPVPFSFTRHVLRCPRQNLQINSKAITVQLQFLCAMLLCSSRHWQLFHNEFISACGGKYFTVLSSPLQAARETPLAGKRGVGGGWSRAASWLWICSMEEELRTSSLSRFKIQLHPGHEHCPSVSNLLRLLCSGGCTRLQGCSERDSPTREDEKPLAASFSFREGGAGWTGRSWSRCSRWIPLVPLCCPSPFRVCNVMMQSVCSVPGQ